MIETRMPARNPVAGVWMNTKQEKFKDVYGFYAIASSKPLERIRNDYLLSSIGIGVDNQNWRAEKEDRLKPSNEFSHALFNNKADRNLYPNEIGKITFWGETLFRTNIRFPENIPGGTYIAEVYLISDGQITSVQSTPIYVNKVGFEAFMHDLAHYHSVIYGVISVIIALVAGWLASIVFHRI